MIQLSKFPIKTKKNIPHGSDNRSTGLLLQAGFIRQEVAGSYSYLPFGLKVLKKISDIVREEMDEIGAFETLMPVLGSKEHWSATNRWDTMDVIFKLDGAGNKQYALNPTHEEVVSPLIGEFIQSYKDLEFGIYQIQNKLRNEARAKSGLLRGREFIMKDLYSFHKTEKNLDEYYDKIKKVYKKIFSRLGIGEDTFITLADGGNFTDKYSHEFQTILPIGEDEIFICDVCKTSHNKEILDGEFKCVDCGATSYRLEKASEVGNIFPLMTKFSEAFGIKYADENGKDKPVVMGCYGMGISRLMGVIAEKFMDERGLVWPKSIAPATHYIIVIGDDNLSKAKKLAISIENEGAEVIIDDRSKGGFGQKAGDCDLMGIPNRIVISPKTIEAGGYELKKRGEKEVMIKPL